MDTQMDTREEDLLVGIWQRTPEETDWEYALFLRYRDLRPLDRSVRNLERILKDEYLHHPEIPAAPRSPFHQGKLLELSRKFSWAERAAAWDAFLQRERDLSIIAAARASSEEAVRLAQDSLAAAQKFYDILKSRLEKGALEKADLATLLKVWPTALRAMQSAFQIMRLAGGQSTENVALSGRVLHLDGTDLSLEKLSDEQLRAARAVISRLIAEAPAEAAEELLPAETLDVPES